MTGAEQRWSDEELYQLLKDVFPVPREENNHEPDDDRQNRD